MASTLATLSFLPQVVKTWRSRSARDFSLATLVMLETGTAIWIFHGVLRDAPAIWLGNSVTFALAGFILSVKLRSGRDAETPRKTQEMTVALVDDCRL